ncbi:hypothetical protein LEMLEM_LOCUS14330, partial [Lemmus lemmus]
MARGLQEVSPTHSLMLDACPLLSLKPLQSSILSL